MAKVCRSVAVASLGKLWAGRAYGTSTGNLAISFEKDDAELEGIVRFHDEVYGLVVYKVNGKYDDEVVLTGNAITEVEGVVFGELTVKAVLTPEGSLKGEWSTSLGSGGPFVVHPHGGVRAGNDTKADLEVEQFYTQSYTLGALTLSKADVLSLIDITRKDFNSGGKLIVTYRNGGAEITKHCKDFIVQMDGLNRLNYLKLFIQEPDEFEINKIVLVELAEHGVNRVVVQGVREIWVEGKARTLRNELGKNEKVLATNFKKFGFNLSQIALFTMIVVMVDIQSFWTRLGVGAMFLGAIKFVEWLHVAFIPNASIRLAVGSDTWVNRWGASMFSWISALTTTVVGGYIVYKVTTAG